MLYLPAMFAVVAGALVSVEEDVAVELFVLEFVGCVVVVLLVDLHAMTQATSRTSAMPA